MGGAKRHTGVVDRCVYEGFMLPNGGTASAGVSVLGVPYLLNCLCLCMPLPGIIVRSHTLEDSFSAGTNQAEIYKGVGVLERGASFVASDHADCVDC